MMKMLLVLVLLGVGACGGFFAGMLTWYGSEKTVARLAIAQDRIGKLEDDLAKGEDRIVELESDLAAAKRAVHEVKVRKQKPVPTSAAPAMAAETNAAERVIAVEGDGKDVLDALKGQLSHEEFSQVTNAMTQMRARLAEKAKGRMEFLASINLDGMSADERKNHAKFLELMERREAAAAKMKGGIPDAATIQKLVELEVEMTPVAKKARSALVRQVARELGYQGEDVEVVRDTIDTIFDCTSSGGLGGLGDVLEGAEGMPGMSVSPSVSVETHVIGL